ncbi:Uncharacterised protein [Legionella lansingensis]|uniref:Uncharacterized protein n=1 Tax=Legionella lansingensis TaxID=45067 RepID=A0A0W0VTH2_9GAMM|nr:hypothetical protein [Legionella lansingensis]KTD23390.1 hypothetical protein Llan_0889 [Legionella lansingensis]SNV49501.1 Uncharacterised protein [Legionella lansingensis]
MDANIIGIAETSSRIGYLSQNMDTVLTLGLTILAEWLAFFIFIKKNVPQRHVLGWILFIVGINCLTNPLAQMIYSSLKTLNFRPLDWLLTEILVILGEAFLIYEIMAQTFRRGLFYSMLLNITSILVGAILCWLNLLPWCY